MTTQPLHCERHGNGPPIVVLHGFTGSAHSMRGIAQPLADEYETIVPDLPGHGRSTGRAAGGYEFEQCLRDLVATLELTGHERAHWIGYSMGARLALGCAVRFPRSVASLVLIGARAGIADEGERAARRRADESLAQRIEGDGIAAFVDEWMALPLFATQRRLGPAFLEEQRRARLANDPLELAASLRGLGPAAQPALFAELARVTVPVLLVAGELDSAFVASSRELARLLPRAEVCDIADAGHAPHLERPDAVLRVVRDFLRRTTAGSRPSICMQTRRPPDA
jgi:2-succinyl-6-hydroxy-2,4-cyclohexadiene-1-carboxylate synthase